MIAYIFTGEELRFLCGVLGVRGLPSGEFSGGEISDTQCSRIAEGLSVKGFVSMNGKKAVINSGIAFLVQCLGRAEKLYQSVSGDFFAGYVCNGISLLLTRDRGSGNYFLYPFEGEEGLIARLREENISKWSEICGRENIYG